MSSIIYVATHLSFSLVILLFFNFQQSGGNWGLLVIYMYLGPTSFPYSSQTFLDPTNITFNISFTFHIHHFTFHFSTFFPPFKPTLIRWVYFQFKKKRWVYHYLSAGKEFFTHSKSTFYIHKILYTFKMRNNNEPRTI